MEEQIPVGVFREGDFLKSAMEIGATIKGNQVGPWKGLNHKPRWLLGPDVV